MKTTDIKDAIFIYRLIATNTENSKTTFHDYNDMNEALTACIRMMSATPDTIIYQIETIVKPTYQQAQIIGIMPIPRRLKAI